MKITIKKIIILSFIAFVISSFNNVFAANYAGNYYENKRFQVIQMHWNLIIQMIQIYH